MTRLWQAAYDAQLRARTPPFPGPLGAVFEQDGPIVRAHYGTHGTVDHRDLGPDLDPVIRRQQEAFAARAEPVRWKVHVNDPPELARRLVAAGFTPGWERPVLVAEIDGLSAAPVALPPGQRLTTGVRAASALDLAANSGPHRTALTESIADGDYEGWNRDVSVVELGGRTRAAGWAILVDGTEFVSVGGLSAPEPAFLPAWIAWIARRTRGRDRWRYFVAEAGGDLRQMLLGAGFRQVTTVRSYHWAPPGHPAAQRPVVLVFDDPAGDAVWERFRSHWAVSGDSRKGPAPTEPPDSVTWNLGAIDGNEAAVEELDRIIRRGLRAVVRPGERVYVLNAHPGLPLRPAPHRRAGTAPGTALRVPLRRRRPPLHDGGPAHRHVRRPVGGLALRLRRRPAPRGAARPHRPAPHRPAPRRPPGRQRLDLRP